MIDLEEPFSYEFEKRSCKDYKRYVNLCIYVDGDLKNKPASSDQYLPNLTRFLEKKSACNPSQTDSIGFANSEIDSLIFNYINKKEPDIYNSIIKELQRKSTRSISSTSGKSVNAHCEQVRTSYAVLGCQKWENVSDYEPVYMSQEQMRERRLKKLDDSANSDK
jgi:hypothetical protein